jgi:hypothetical protein
MGWTGHITLIVEEIVKLFSRYPSDIHAAVEPLVSQPDWDEFVSTTLRESREKDSRPLGGGVASLGPASVSAEGLSDEDDEFPMTAGARTLRSVNDEGGLRALSRTAVAVNNTVSEGPGPRDQVRTDSIPETITSLLLIHAFFPVYTLSRSASL